MRRESRGPPRRGVTFTWEISRDANGDDDAIWPNREVGDVKTLPPSGADAWTRERPESGDDQRSLPRPDRRQGQATSRGTYGRSGARVPGAYVAQQGAGASRRSVESCACSAGHRSIIPPPELTLPRHLFDSGSIRASVPSGRAVHGDHCQRDARLGHGRRSPLVPSRSSRDAGRTPRARAVDLTRYWCQSLAPRSWARGFTPRRVMSAAPPAHEA